MAGAVEVADQTGDRIGASADDDRVRLVEDLARLEGDGAVGRASTSGVLTSHVQPIPTEGGVGVEARGFRTERVVAHVDDGVAVVVQPHLVDVVHRSTRHDDGVLHPVGDHGVEADDGRPSREPLPRHVEVNEGVGRTEIALDDPEPEVVGHTGLRREEDRATVLRSGHQGGRLVRVGIGLDVSRHRCDAAEAGVDLEELDVEARVPEAVDGLAVVDRSEVAVGIPDMAIAAEDLANVQRVAGCVDVEADETAVVATNASDRVLTAEDDGVVVRSGAVVDHGRGRTQRGVLELVVHVPRRMGEEAKRVKPGGRTHGSEEAQTDVGTRDDRNHHLTGGGRELDLDLELRRRVVGEANPTHQDELVVDIGRDIDGRLVGRRLHTVLRHPVELQTGGRRRLRVRDGDGVVDLRDVAVRVREGDLGSVGATAVVGHRGLGVGEIQVDGAATVAGIEHSRDQGLVVGGAVEVEGHRTTRGDADRGAVAPVEGLLHRGILTEGDLNHVGRDASTTGRGDRGGEPEGSASSRLLELTDEVERDRAVAVGHLGRLVEPGDVHAGRTTDLVDARREGGAVRRLGAELEHDGPGGARGHARLDLLSRLSRDLGSHRTGVGASSTTTASAAATSDEHCHRRTDDGSGDQSGRVLFAVHDYISFRSATKAGSTRVLAIGLGGPSIPCRSVTIGCTKDGQINAVLSPVLLILPFLWKTLQPIIRE